MDNNHIAGIFLGAIVGIYKGIIALLSSFTVFTWITWEQAIDTGSLALIGGACGWLGAEGLKWIKTLKQKKKKR